MPLAYWCVLIAALLPIIWAGYAKAGTKSDNRYPREEVDDLPPMKRRAYAAHQNAYECFPVFAAAVIIAVTQRAPIEIVNWLAAIYIVLRIAHALLYIYNKPPLRSLAFLLALLVNIAIFVLPAFGLS
ncbi:MAG TPA: MAPEG family protein [Afipia sp.]